MTARQALMDYCIARRCDDCPMNTPELGCINPSDPCVVSLAILHLEHTEVAA